MKCAIIEIEGRWNRLPPYGGSGLKCHAVDQIVVLVCLPPYGGSGLKLQALSACARAVPGLPPYGGSGLKSYTLVHDVSSILVSLHTEGVD